MQKRFLVKIHSIEKLSTAESDKINKSELMYPYKNKSVLFKHKSVFHLLTS